MKIGSSRLLLSWGAGSHAATDRAGMGCSCHTSLILG